MDWKPTARSANWFWRHDKKDQTMKLQHLAIAGMAAAALATTANAITFTTYTSEAAWNAAMAGGAISLETFTGEATGTFTSRDFGDFTATLLSGTGALPSIVDKAGDRELRLQSSTHTSATQLHFDAPIHGIAFDYGKIYL